VRLFRSNQSSFMKPTSSKVHLAVVLAFVWHFALPTICLSQEKPVGPFAFVNAIDSTEPTFVYLNGDSYRPRGYSVGQMTFGARTYAGNPLVTVENKELGTASISVLITATYCPVIIAYAHVSQDSEGKTKRELKVLTIPSKAVKGGAFSAFYASNSEEVTIEANSQILKLPDKTLTRLADTRSISYRLPSDNGAVRQVSPEVPTHVILVVFDLKDGKKSVSEFEDVSSE